MRRLIVGVVALVLVVPSQVLAVDDTTAPVGTLSVAHYDIDLDLVRLNVAATDDISGVATVEVSGNGTTWASFPYAATVDWALFDPNAGGSAALYDRTIRVRWTDIAGNTSSVRTTRLYVNDWMGLEFPVAPVTGAPYTIRPIYPPGTVLEADFPCGWELRWGNDASLIGTDFNYSYGSLFTSGLADRGFCGAWTFTIPDVPVRQFEIHFNSSAGGVGDTDFANRPKFYPTGSSTDRRIRASNLPLVQVLPDSEQMIVGVPITYRAYFIGTTLKSTDTWLAYKLGYGAIGPRYGTSTFTFTPPSTGNWLVAFNGAQGRPFDLNATWDPKARRPDSSPPNTTPPVQQLAIATPGPTVPVRLDWSGTDLGWGIERFRLQKSVNGGAWQNVPLPTPKSKFIVLQLDQFKSYRFRVRAVDWYGNVGAWDYGPTFRPRIAGDAATVITYSGTWTTEPDPTALGGALHVSDDAGAAARLEFVGRDVAWLAEIGPGKGRARVYIDGALAATIDLNAGSDVAHKVVFRRHWATAGSHVIRIVVEGTVGRPIVTLDGFAILR